MFLPWLIIGILLGVGVICIGVPILLHWKDYYGYTGRAVASTIVGCASLIFAACLLIWPVTYAVEKDACNDFERKSGRETVFVTYNSASWDCLTRAQDGQWISLSQIGDYDRNGDRD